MAIENDQYEKVFAPTYTRGYLRSYAKIVDVDEQSLIQLFNSNLENDEAPEIIPEVSQKTQVTSSDKPVKIVTYLIVFALMLLLLAWWQSKHIIDDTQLLVSDETTSSEVDNAGIAPAFNYDYAIIEHPDVPNVNIENDSINNNYLIDSVETSDTDQESAFENTINVDTGSNDGETGELKLIIDEESWIEVYNVNDKRLFQKLAQPGSMINVTGLIPLSVLIGHSEGVRVIFNGENIDTQPYTRANVARLILGE